MATGEYVSVQSQADTESAALEKERTELRENPKGEHHELAHIYIERGLEPSLARPGCYQPDGARRFGCTFEG